MPHRDRRPIDTQPDPPDHFHTTHQILLPQDMPCMTATVFINTAATHSPTQPISSHPSLPDSSATQSPTHLLTHLPIVPVSMQPATVHYFCTYYLFIYLYFGI